MRRRKLAAFRFGFSEGLLCFCCHSKRDIMLLHRFRMATSELLHRPLKLCVRRSKLAVPRLGIAHFFQKRSASPAANVEFNGRRFRGGASALLQMDQLVTQLRHLQFSFTHLEL